MRKRRRARYTWLPPYLQATGTELIAGERSTITNTTLIVNEETEQALAVQPLVADYKGPQDVGEDYLTAVINNDYVFRRVVGKIHVAFDQVTNELAGTPLTWPYPTACIAAAGIFVARTTEDAPYAAPVGWGTADVAELYSPLYSSTTREPWVWRRTWLLGNRLSNYQLSAGVGLTPAESNHPASNGEYGSVMDGPHIDSKVGRRVGSDERAFLIFAAKALTPTISDIISPAGLLSVRFTHDLRILGALRRARTSKVF